MSQALLSAIQNMPRYTPGSNARYRRGEVLN
jgi:hypothetical protein